MREQSTNKSKREKGKKLWHVSIGRISKQIHLTPTWKHVVTTNFRSNLSGDKLLLGMWCFHEKTTLLYTPSDWNPRICSEIVMKFNNLRKLMASVYLRQRFLLTRHKPLTLMVNWEMTLLPNTLLNCTSVEVRSHWLWPIFHINFRKNR